MEADKLTSLAAALEYVEQNLTSDFSQEKCARYACCSLSGLQKLFRSVFRRSVGDYVARRRLTAAARELQQTDRTALDIAVEFGWGSAEAFTRAFSRVWGVTPSEYRRSWHFSGLCPRLDFPRSFCEIISKTILTLWEICDKIIIYSFEKRYLYDRYRFRPCRLLA